MKGWPSQATVATFAARGLVRRADQVACNGRSPHRPWSRSERLSRDGQAATTKRRGGTISRARSAVSVSSTGRKAGCAGNRTGAVGEGRRLGRGLSRNWSVRGER